VLNRLDGKPFDDADQRLFEVRGIQFYSNNILFQQDLVFLGDAASVCSREGGGVCCLYLWFGINSQNTSLNKVASQ